jgi:tetratricopeptide (TPR) repeat protein
MAALPLRKLDQYDEEAQELPTNELHSGRLQSRPLHVVGAEGEGEEPSNVIDYVSRIASRDTGRLGARPTISLLPPPTGMYHRAAPARMVPARGFSIGGLLKKLGLYLLLPAALVGAVAWAVVTYVGTDWVADILAPPPAAQTETGPVDDGFAPGPDVQPEMNLPPLEGTPIELRERGITLHAQGNYMEAIRYLEAAANLANDDALAYYHLGLSYLAVTGKPHSVDDAELAFRTAASLQPSWAATHRMLAESLIRGGFFEEAIGPALEATRLEPAMSESWLTLSRAYRGAGREEEATQAYAEATRHAPPPPITP